MHNEHEDVSTFTTADGAVIAYRDEGSGRPVVLVHALGCRGAHWAFQRQALLDAGYRVIAVDLRFHGDSAATANGHRVARLGHDVAELVTMLQLDDVMLVGHSMGASALFGTISSIGTSRIAKVVIIDQSPRMVNDRDWPLGLRLVTWDRLEGQLAGVEPWGDQAREPAMPDHVGEMLAEYPFVDHFSGEHSALVADHFVADWRDEVVRIDVPTWIATGRHAPGFPLEAMEWLADNIADARLTVYENSGHCPHWNEPDAFNADLLRFLQA
jgi:pimeloyl-ACP methyl ester carboxylesterase